MSGLLYIILLRCQVSRALSLLALGCCLITAAPALRGDELQTAAQVRSLTVEQAALQYPVKIRGVVTFYDDQLYSRFVQDSTAGIYIDVRNPTNFPHLLPGQIVEVEGVTGPGEYAPIVVPYRVRVLGDGKLPAPKPAVFGELASGKDDSQFVEITGIVRSGHFSETYKNFLLEIATGEGRLLVYVKELPVERPEQLVDCTVRVRGVCSTRFNRQRQLFAIRLMVPRPEDLQIEIPAPRDPFAIGTRPLGSLLQFAPQESYGHRVKVAGSVIYFEPGKVVYLQDGEQGLEVQTRRYGLLKLGDRVEALGFPGQGEYTPLLLDATFRKIADGEAPAPARVTHDEALKGMYDCRLIQISALVIDRAQHGSEPYLILQDQDCIFPAYLRSVNGIDPFADLKNGSRVKVTGVCRIEPGEWQAGEGWRAKAFRVHLRSLSDLVLLQAPPWWSLTRVLWFAGGMVLVALGAFAWVVVLRRRVYKQTEIIRVRLQTEAALKERYEDLFENANDMVFTHDLSGRMTSINKTGERLLQRNRAKVVMHNLIELIAEDQRPAARQWLDQIIKGEEMPAAEWDFVNVAGQRVKLEISSRLIEQNGLVLEVEGIARDITERRRLERELLEISNREQRRIGHDLHDGVCQQLAAIAYLIDILSDRLQEMNVPEAKELDRIGNLVNEVNAQARGVARGLFPVRLQEHGLVLALEELVANASNRYQVVCSFVCQSAPVKLDSEVELHLYFIAQEALLNAVNHGKATNVTMTLTADGDRLKLTVQDNGSGFSLSDKTRTGMGLRIMRYRAKVIGATLDLQSQVNQGTQVTCELSAALRKSV